MRLPFTPRCAFGNSIINIVTKSRATLHGVGISVRTRKSRNFRHSATFNRSLPTPPLIASSTAARWAGRMHR